MSRLSPGVVLTVSCGTVAVIAVVDAVTGYEISVSLFYLAPVAFAAWYAGHRASLLVAALSSVSWFVADLAAGSHYSYWTLPIWNAVVRLGFFVINGTLVAILRKALLVQQTMASTDALTAVFSRRAFQERFEHDLQIARRTQTRLTLALLDIDNFKHLNDTHGHAKGDQALVSMGAVLKNVTRSVDTVARLGGDEFVMVLPDTDHAGAIEVMSKLRNDLHLALKQVAPGLACSIGVYTFAKPPDNVEEAVRAADALMYDAKRQGKNVVVYGHDENRSPIAINT
jgi:diguanylate cyclase (GGDEF)-like protein